MGVWECVYHSEGSLVGKYYKFKITNNGIAHYKADPYAFHSQTNTQTASMGANIDGFEWNVVCEVLFSRKPDFDEKTVSKTVSNFN